MAPIRSASAIASTLDILSPANARRSTMRNCPPRMTATASSPSTSAGLAACARQFDEQELVALVLAIANINVWNRLNVAIRQPVGAWKM
jgi:hypothetical protein